MTLPVTSVRHIVDLKKKLDDSVFFQYYGIAIAGPDFDDLVSEIVEAMPVGVQRDAVAHSITDIIGQVLTEDIVAPLCWRLAANVQRLKDGAAVKKWVSQPYPEWVPVQVDEVHLKNRQLKYDREGHRLPDGKFRLQSGAYVTFRILAGLPAGLQTTRFWSREFVFRWRTELGFSRWDQRRYSRDVTRQKNNFPLTDLRELTRCRLTVLIDPQFSSDRPGFREMRCTGSQLSWNRAIFRKRKRDDFQCPYQFTHACYRCPVGYDRCSAACHARTYHKAVCEGCEQEKWHDKGSRLKLCLECNHEENV